MVHAAVRGVLMALRPGRTIDPARLIDRVHNVMRQDFVFSRQRAYWRRRHRKEFSGLVEHEYEEPLENADWKSNWETVRSALSWFCASRWIALAHGLRKDAWLEVDLMDFEKSIFHLEGVKIFAVPDFAYLEKDGAVVVDWKTGRAREGYDEQVLGYALYLSTRYGIPVSRIKASLVYLNDKVEHTVQIDERAVEGFREHFSKSIASMRALLADPATNTPLPESHFPQTDNLTACARCVFRRPCGRERMVAEARIVAPPLSSDPVIEPTEPV
jgi:hypothetical protein